MSKSEYYLTEYDGSVCRENPNGPGVELDEFEVVTALNRMSEVLERVSTQAVERDAENNRLWTALNNIGGGHASSDVLIHVHTDTPAQFQRRMWSWSQEHARAALHTEGGGDE